MRRTVRGEVGGGRRVLLAAGMVACAVAFAGCQPVSAAHSPPPHVVRHRHRAASAPAVPTSTPATATPATAATEPAPGARTVLAALDRLRVKGRAPLTGYARNRFAQAWLDADRNGCDTRNDILARDLSETTTEPGTHGCVVLDGTLNDPYTATTIRFVYGDGDLVDIDHIVALGDAWQTGAIAWGIAKRAAFANDPFNLVAVDAGANRAKGDADAATWLPPAKAVRCAYVTQQVAVKTKYHLWVTAAERSAITRVLAGCPTKALPPDSGAPTRVDQHLVDPGPPAIAHPAPRPDPTSAPASGGDVHYANCTEARAAGAAPVHRGDPGYSSELDRDGDGVGCES